MAMAEPSDDFIRRRTIELALRDGTRVRLRPIRPQDKSVLAESMKRLSPESRYRRFFSPIDTLTPGLLTLLTEIDYVNHFAWVALATDEIGEHAVGVGRYIRLADSPTSAEIAVTIRDDYQGRGLGTLLYEMLGLVAHEQGITEFMAFVLPENSPMRHLLRGEGMELHFSSGDGVLRGSGPVRSQRDELLNADLYDDLRLAARGEVGLA